MPGPPRITWPFLPGAHVLFCGSVRGGAENSESEHMLEIKALSTSIPVVFSNLKMVYDTGSYGVSKSVVRQGAVGRGRGPWK